MGTNATWALSEQRALGDIGARECVPLYQLVLSKAVAMHSLHQLPSLLNHGSVVTKFWNLDKG
jgi:hypothetical protein